MRGHLVTADPNRYVVEKWVGKTVQYNGTELTGKVVVANWGGYGRPASLRVEWPDGATAPANTDTEHVTLVREA